MLSNPTSSQLDALRFFERPETRSYKYRRLTTDEALSLCETHDVYRTDWKDGICTDRYGQLTVPEKKELIESMRGKFPYCARLFTVPIDESPAIYLIDDYSDG